MSGGKQTGTRARETSQEHEQDVGGLKGIGNWEMEETSNGGARALEETHLVNRTILEGDTDDGIGNSEAKEIEDRDRTLGKENS